MGILFVYFFHSTDLVSIQSNSCPNERFLSQGIVSSKNSPDLNGKFKLVERFYNSLKLSAVKDWSSTQDLIVYF